MAQCAASITAAKRTAQNALQIRCPLESRESGVVRPLHINLARVRRQRTFAGIQIGRILRIIQSDILCPDHLCVHARTHMDTTRGGARTPSERKNEELQNMTMRSARKSRT